MRHIKTILGISIFFLFSGALETSAQESAKKIKDSKRDYSVFLKRTLQLDSAKADQVAQVQQNYKDALGKVVADSTLGMEGRREKIRQLIEDKNRRLKLLLSPAQQQKLIPGTELTAPEKQKP